MYLHRVGICDREGCVCNEKVSQMPQVFLCSARTAGFEPDNCIYGRKMEGEAEKKAEIRRGGGKGETVRHSLN